MKCVKGRYTRVAKSRLRLVPATGRGYNSHCVNWPFLLRRGQLLVSRIQISLKFWDESLRCAWPWPSVTRRFEVVSECSWRAIQTCTLLKELFCSVFPIGKIIPMVEYFGLKRAVFCSLNPLELFFRDQTNSKSRQPSLLMEKVEQEVEWHAPFARRTAMQATCQPSMSLFILTAIWKTLQQEGGQVMLLIQVSAIYSTNCFSWSVAAWARNCSNIGLISPSGRNGRAMSLRTYRYVPLSWLYWCWSPSSWIWKTFVYILTFFLLLSGAWLDLVHVKLHLVLAESLLAGYLMLKRNCWSTPTYLSIAITAGNLVWLSFLQRIHTNSNLCLFNHPISVLSLESSHHVRD